jgi:heme-degrading monooxygenase HmoA
MILEVAEFRIDPARRAEFEEALQRGAATVVAMAQGYHGHAILRCIESHDRYLLHVRWCSVEAHDPGFRGSPAFADWRAIVGPFFASSPVVAHYEWVADAIRTH